jgi:hypothetical protein
MAATAHPSGLIKHRLYFMVIPSVSFLLTPIFCKTEDEYNYCK